jgi:hypothetical protein
MIRLRANHRACETAVRSTASTASVPSRKANMSRLCAYTPCKCVVADDEQFCGDVCAMFGARLVNEVRISTGLRVMKDKHVVPRCACGHESCGDGLVSAAIH